MPALQIDSHADLLLLIDVQPDFMPGGSLPVPAGDEVVPLIGRLLDGPFAHAAATQDWHPAGHSSFASSHPGLAAFSEIEAVYGRQTLWPDHCIQGTPGAALDPRLDDRRIELIVRKGFRPEIDSYSAFRENDRRTSTGLEAWIQARGFRRLFLAGLALDYCVLWSALDAAAAGFETVIIEDACRGIGLPMDGGSTTIDVARRQLAAADVRTVRADDLA